MFAAAFFLCAVTHAVRADTITHEFSVICDGTTGQLCEPPFTVVTETPTGVLKARYRIVDEPCSSIRLLFFVDGELRHTSGFLGWPANPDAGPLETPLVDLGPVTPGTHQLGVESEGRLGGCNTGRAWSWGGALDVVTSDAPVEPALVEVVNFPDPQNIVGTVEISNLPPVQAVTGVVSVSNLPTSPKGALSVARPAVENTILDLLDGEILLAPDGVATWESAVFDTGAATRVGLKIASSTSGTSPVTTAGSGVTCSLLWQWTGGDEFVGPAIVAHGTDVQWDLAYGLRGKVVCVPPPAGGSGTLADVKVFVRTE